MGALLEITRVDDFRREIEQRPEPAIVMFTTSWCPFCRRFKPRFVEAAARAGVRSALVYIDDWNNPLWEEYRVDVVPTLAVFDGGKAVARRDGVLGSGLGAHDLDEILAKAAGLATR